MVPLEKLRQLKLSILVFQNQRQESLFQKKALLILKILLTRRKIFKTLARLIDKYVTLHTQRHCGGMPL